MTKSDRIVYRLPLNKLMKSNHIKYIRNMRHIKNKFILYSLGNNKSDVFFESDMNLVVASGKSMEFSKVGLLNIILYINAYFFTKLKRQLNFILHFLCVVHGIQFNLFKDIVPSWYTYRVYNLLFNHRLYLIQITDLLFIIQSLLKDVKQILIGPILISIDLISLSKIKNYLYEHITIFIKWLFLIFQTFILQIDEDGEEILNKIKETDVFRRQKPGVVPFLKKNLNSDEDFTFLGLRHLKRNSYLFFRMISLIILPFIIYRANQKFQLKSSLPKLAYVIDNVNQHIPPINRNWSKSILSRVFLSQSTIKSKSECNDFQSIQTARSSTYNNNRIINLWNANKIKNDQDIIILGDHLYNASLNISIDYMLGNKGDNFRKKINRKNRSIYFSKIWNKLNFILFCNEYDLSNIVYSNAYLLIKPRESSFDLLHKMYDSLFSRIDNNLLKYNNLTFNKIEKFRNQYIEFKKMFFTYMFSLTKHDFVLFQNPYWSEKNKLRYFIESLFYRKGWIKDINEHNNMFEFNLDERLKNQYKSKKKVLSKNESDKERILFMIEQYLQEVVSKSKNSCVNWLNIKLQSSKLESDYFNRNYYYNNSLINLKTQIVYPEIESSFNDDSQNRHLSIFFFNHHNNHCMIDNLSYNSFHSTKPFFFLDSLYSVPMESLQLHLGNEVAKNFIKIIPVWYINMSHQLNVFSKTNFFHFIPNNQQNDALKQKIYQMIAFEINRLKNISNTFIKTTYLDKILTSKTDIVVYEREFIPMNSMDVEDIIQISNTKNCIRNLNQSKSLSELSSLYSLNLWQPLANVFKQTNDLELSLKNLNEFNNQNILKSTDCTQIEFLSSNSLKELLDNSYIINQIQTIKEYIIWSLTSEWWVFLASSIHKLILITWQDILDVFTNIHEIIALPFFHRLTDSYYENFEYILTTHLDLISNWKLNWSNLIVKKQIKKAIDILPLSICQDVGISSYGLTLASYWQIIVSFISTYWFSVLLGGSSLLLWIFFERVRSLTHLSWNTELDLLVLRSLRENRNPISNSYSINKKNQLREQYNLSINKCSVWLRILFSNLIGSKLQYIWLYQTNTSDVYGDRRYLSFQIIVGEKSRLELTLSNLDQNFPLSYGYECFKQEGLDYLKQLTDHHYKWYKNKNRNLIHNQRFIPFGFYKTHSTALDLWQSNPQSIKKKYTPISLQLAELYSKAILLIGGKDTGKSYLVKSLAADRALPLVYIAVDKLLDVLEFEDTPLEGDSSLYFLRENVLRFKVISTFIKKVQSSIIWIPNLDKIHYSYNYTSQTREYCTFLIMRFLLKDITEMLGKHENTILVGSCEDTSYLDPGFISIKRFSRFINLRMPSNLRRPQIFINFLHKKNIRINTETTWDIEFSNNTMGFNLRDLTSLANQAFLVSLQKNTKYLNLDEVRLVLYRGSRANENTGITKFLQDEEVLNYKIGRAIIQTTLVRPNPMIPLQAKHDLWKPRFYYLSKAYLQPDYLESTVTQLNIFPHILSCLAGSASRDACIFLDKKSFDEDSFTLNKELIHDIDLAVNLFESIFKEFPSLDIYNDENSEYSFLPQFKRNPYSVNIDQANHIAKQSFSIYQSTLNFTNSVKENLADGYLENFSFNIAWSSKIERLSLSRNILFDLFKRVDENISLFSSFRYFGGLIKKDMLFETINPYSGIYHRSWDIMKSQISKDLDYSFYSMLSTQRIVNMGLPIVSSQVMEYEPPENDLLFVGGRLIWNPAATFVRNLVFRNRQLFANEELLSILYLLYQSQKTRRFFTRKSRKKEIWNPDAYLERLAMSNKPQKDVDKNKLMDMNQNFNNFKNLAHANANFQRPQAEVPNNSEMSFIKRFISYNRFSKFSFTEDVFYQNNRLQYNHLTKQELLSYGSIVEIYFYLIKFFMKNRFLLETLKNNLLKQENLFEEDLQKIIFESSAK